MRRVPPSMLVREELDQLLHGELDKGTNIVSSLVDTVTRLVVQQLLEAEQSDFLGGRGRYERRTLEGGLRNGYEPGRIRSAEGAIKVRVPQVRDTTQPYRSSLMTFLDGNSDVLDRLVTEMYARGLSTRDVEDAFRDATGELSSPSPPSRRSPTACGRTTRPSSPETCRRSRSSTSSATPSSSRSAARAPRRPFSSPGASTPKAANNCCTWPSATRSPRPPGPSSSATCSPGGCGPRPRSRPTGPRG